MNENDARVQKTRHQLWQAMIDLVLESGYEHITVRDIAQRAGVGYKTFYRHYEGKEALLQALVDDLIAEFRQTLLPPGDEGASINNTLAVLAFAETHARLFLMILNSSAADQLLEPSVAIALDEGYQTFNSSLIPDELMAYHFATTMLGLLRWWLESEMACTKEEMAEYINLLLIQPMAQLGKM